MRMTCRFALLVGLLLGGLPGARAQARRPAAAIPRIDVEDYKLDVTLNPEEHEFTGTARITFRPLEKTETAVFEVSENLSIQKVLDDKGTEVLFGQEEAGPGLLSLHFAAPLAPQQSFTVSIEYSGGFDRDRYSRNYTRDESVAYIGPEGSYLLYPSKWLPISGFLVDRATSTLEVTAPLGTIAIGPGVQLPVVTKGITEKFGWVADRPILPGSFVAGPYFERKVEADGIRLSCFAFQEHLEAMQKAAEAIAKILAYYGKTHGPAGPASGFRLVEVDDRLARQHGDFGTIFITSGELGAGTLPVRAFARRAAYQWWMETAGVGSKEDLWLADGMSYYAAAAYLGHLNGPEAFGEELNNLAVLALKFESKSPVGSGYSLGYGSEQYESVVAGKGAWVLNMLRQLVGDAHFAELLDKYFARASSEGGSSALFEKLAGEVYDQDLRWFFAQWIDAIGVPTLQTDFVIFRSIDGFRVSGTVSQDRDLFRMPLEVEVVSKGGVENTRIMLDGKSTPFDVVTPTWPEKVVLDPKGKVLRDSPELQLAVQLALGTELKEKGDYVEALRAFENALKKNPRSSIAHFRTAEVFFEQFNLNAAADSFRNALNGDKQPPWTEVWSYIYLGKIFDVLGQRQRAMAEYNKALNTKDDTDGAQAEAKRWLSAPYTKQATTMDGKQPD